MTEEYSQHEIEEVKALHKLLIETAWPILRNSKPNLAISALAVFVFNVIENCAANGVESGVDLFCTALKNIAQVEKDDE